MNTALEEEYGRWLDEFQDETDRACAVLGAAFLDHALGELLHAFLREDERVRERLFGRNRPLANFGTRVDVAFALGIIGTTEHHDLDLVRKIRNHFAHELTGAFNVSPVADWCRELHGPEELGFRMPHDAVEPVRFRFITAVVLIAVTLRGRATTLAHRQEPESMRDVEARVRASLPSTPDE